MKYYQLSYLLSPDLSEDELKSLPEKIISLIKEEGGILNTAGPALKKPLFLSGKKKTFSYLATVSFHFSPEKLGNLEKRLKSEEKLFRYLILAKSLPKEILKMRPAVTRKKADWSSKKAKRIISKPKVELKEIEKKLEEILKET